MRNLHFPKLQGPLCLYFYGARVWKRLADSALSLSPYRVRVSHATLRTASQQVLFRALSLTLPLTVSLYCLCVCHKALAWNTSSHFSVSLSLSRPENLNQASKVPGPSEEEKMLCKQGKCLNGGIACMHTPRRNQNLQFRVSFMPAWKGPNRTRFIAKSTCLCVGYLSC